MPQVFGRFVRDSQCSQSLGVQRNVKDKQVVDARIVSVRFRGHTMHIAQVKYIFWGKMYGNVNLVQTI